MIAISNKKVEDKRLKAINQHKEHYFSTCFYPTQRIEKGMNNTQAIPCSFGSTERSFDYIINPNMVLKTAKQMK